MKIIQCKQYSDLWWAIRRGIPTASCMDKILTPENGALSKSAIGYACELIGQLIDPGYGHEETYVSAAMRNGTIMEPEARAWYEMEIGESVKQVGFITTDDGAWGASPDGLIGEDGGLELKSPDPKTHVEYLWNAYLDPGWWPPKYKPQVHGSLAISGRAWWSFVSYCPGLPSLHVRIEPDGYTKTVLLRMAEFQEKFAKIKAAVKVTPIPFDVPVERELTEAEIDFGLMGGVSRPVTSDVA